MSSCTLQNASMYLEIQVFMKSMRVFKRRRLILCHTIETKFFHFCEIKWQKTKEGSTYKMFQTNL